MLAFDTCTRRVSVAADGRSWVSPEEKGGNRHLFHGLRALDLENIASVTDVYFTVGPGSFTGVRVGIAAALGFHYGAGVRLHPVGTLKTLAWATGKEGEVTVTLPAYGGEVFVAGYRIIGNLTEEIFAPRLSGSLDDSREIPEDVPLAGVILEHSEQIPSREPPLHPLYVGVSDAQRRG